MAMVLVCAWATEAAKAAATKAAPKDSGVSRIVSLYVTDGAVERRSRAMPAAQIRSRSARDLYVSPMTDM